MKFGKKLQYLLDHSLPEWKPNFLCYKLLKKRLKQLGKSAPMTFLTAAIMDRPGESKDGHSFLIPVNFDELRDGGERENRKRKPDDVFLFEQRKKRKDGTLTDDKPDDVFLFEQRKKRKDGTLTDDLPETQEEGVTGVFPQAQETSFSGGEEQNQSPKRLTENDVNFLLLVKTELHKFNAFFLEKEEEFLIRSSLLEERADEMKDKRVQSGKACGHSTNEDLIDLQRQIVTLHGEMVLLMNYSSLNYVGLLKILKKYDKHSKSRLRQLVHASVLQQPFFSIANLKGMVARSLACEDSLRSIV